jgi:hypothetical protein
MEGKKGGMMNILSQVVRPFVLLVILALAYSVMLTGTQSGITRKLVRWIIAFVLFALGGMMFLSHH